VITLIGHIDGEDAVVVLVGQGECPFAVALVALLVDVLHDLHVVQHLQLVSTQSLAADVPNAYEDVVPLGRMSYLNKHTFTC
jgi:hypothetical protein